MCFSLNYISQDSFTSVFVPSITSGMKQVFESMPVPSWGPSECCRKVGDCPVGGALASFYGQAFSTGGGDFTSTDKAESLSQI